MSNKNVIMQFKLPAYMIIVLSVTITAFLDEETMVNWFVVGTISLSPIILLFYRNVSKEEEKFWFFLFSFLAIIVLFNFASIRWTTVLFSSAFIVFFIAYTRVISKDSPRISFFLSILKVLIIAYWVVLMMQQFCVLLGLPIINVFAYSTDEPWKLNSLMSEPSHSARVIPILMYIYVSMKELLKGPVTLKQSYKHDRLIWFAFVYSCVTMLSATAYIFMFIVFAKFLNRRTIFQSVLIGCLVGVIILQAGTNKVLQRTVNILVATQSMNEDMIIDADGSGAYRIVPFFRGAMAIGFSTKEDFLGHGIDADMRDILPLPGTDKGSAGPFVIWYNYGLILQFIYWYITLSVCYIRKDKISLLVWFLCVFTYGGMNNQIVWLAIVLLYSYKYCLKNKERSLLLTKNVAIK